MADALSSIIAGTDPLAPVELRALQGQQLLNASQDASQWANQGIFGALARTIGAARGSSQSQDALQQLAAARSQALPSVFQALSSGNPYQWGAQNQSASPVALASILANSPDAAKAMFEGSQAALNRNTLQSFQPQSTAPGAPPQPLSKPAARAGIISAAPASPGAALTNSAPTDDQMIAVSKMPDAATVSQMYATPQDRARFLAGLGPLRNAWIMHNRASVAPTAQPAVTPQPQQ